MQNHEVCITDFVLRGKTCVLRWVNSICMIKKPESQLIYVSLFENLILLLIISINENRFFKTFLIIIV